jgi:hypothetical protein
LSPLPLNTAQEMPPAKTMAAAAMIGSLLAVVGGR